MKRVPFSDEGVLEEFLPCRCWVGDAFSVEPWHPSFARGNGSQKPPASSQGRRHRKYGTSSPWRKEGTGVLQEGPQLAHSQSEQSVFMRVPGREVADRSVIGARFTDSANCSLRPWGQPLLTFSSQPQDRNLVRTSAQVFVDRAHILAICRPIRIIRMMSNKRTV
jgi:hypothetical protein